MRDKQLSDDGAGDEDATGEGFGVPPGTTIRTLMICNQKGLHARASARFVQTVEKYDAEVRVSRGGETVGGTSIMGLMMLAAGPGTEIAVSAWGPQKDEVLSALEALVNDGFGEDD